MSSDALSLRIASARETAGSQAARSVSAPNSIPTTAAVRMTSSVGPSRRSRRAAATSWTVGGTASSSGPRASEDESTERFEDADLADGCVQHVHRRVTRIDRKQKPEPRDVGGKVGVERLDVLVQLPDDVLLGVRFVDLKLPPDQVDQRQIGCV